jgi:hypothetical protein
MAEPPRRFPTPWRADKITGGYVVRDAKGQATALLYSHQDPNAAATLAAELRRDTPRDAAGAVLERLGGPIRWISDTRTVKLDDQLRKALREVGS